jgi:glycosyltransferase involved in cell wall biosynthesis
VRAVDATAIAGISHILAGSETVAGRLSSAHGADIASIVSVFHAGPAVEASVDGRRDDADTVLCVSRHDFPKRTELFVHAMNILRPARSVAIGQGGRLGSVMAFDRLLATQGSAPDLSAEDVWLNGPDWVDPASVTGTGTVDFQWDVPPAALRSELQRAACFVAPAFDEDYGLTVLEAMAEGVPVIVCNDGGHLAHLVQHGVNGLVCDPTGPAIAAAARTLLDDPHMAAQLGANGRELARQFTWERAFRELDHGVERVVGCA